MLNHEYELTLIIRPDLEDSATTEVVEKIEGFIGNNEGTLLLRDDWGKRKLAYPIRNHLKGHYVLLQFASPAASIGELERRARNLEPIIRFLTVRVGENIDLAERVEAAKVVQAQRDEEARARAEAAAAAEAEAEAKAEAKAQEADDDAESKSSGESADATA